jgi:hypothetical protein
MKILNILVTILLFASSITIAQSTKQDSIWSPMKIFVGEWTGESAGDPGKGTYERKYQFIFNKKYIEIKNKSTWQQHLIMLKGKSTKILDILVTIKVESYLF